MDRFRIGAFTVSRIEEWAGPFLTPAQLFAGFDEAAYAATRSSIPRANLDPETDAIEARVQSWVIEANGQVILLDTGCGNAKSRPNIPVFGDLQTDFLDRMAGAGFPPERIDMVVCTHLHVDHVGWNTRLQDGAWVPTFPNARYVFPKADRDYWDPANRHLYPDMVGEAVNAGFFADSVQPILDAGLAELVERTVALAPGIRLDPNPGHTPGCQTLTITSEGECAMFVGDVLHHPLQVLNPHWNSIFCEDADAARAARAHVLGRAADEDAVLVPAHFAGEHVLRIARDGAGFAMRPAFA